MKFDTSLSGLTSSAEESRLDGDTDLTRVAILTYEGLSAYEFSCALEIFALPRPELGEGYHCEALAVDGVKVVSTGGVEISVQRDISVLAEFGTVVVPGWPLSRRVVPDVLASQIRLVYANGGRLVSICSGSFLYASLGLLDGKVATTHWAYSDEFKARFPEVKYQGDVLYTEDQRLFTSAGSSAGLDLCLHIIRNDFGHTKANQVARRLVMSPHRAGGQAQFVEQPMLKQSDRFNDALNWALAHIDQVISIDDLAQQACLSRRSFDRQFRAATEMSPKQWLIQQRVKRAQELLESTALNIEQVAIQSGFDKAINLRHHFKSLINVSPSQYRLQFGLQSRELASDGVSYG